MHILKVNSGMKLYILLRRKVPTIVIIVLGCLTVIWNKSLFIDTYGINRKTVLDNSTHSETPSQKPTVVHENVMSGLVTRTGHMEMECKRLKASESANVHNVMINRQHHLAYCYIPKCGCTFWKRVIRFLNKDYLGKTITSPFQIQRRYTHSEKQSNPDTFAPFHGTQDLTRRYTRFMFVRDPYARLWSAYVDKFYLPDFWDRAKSTLRVKRPFHPFTCVHDVSFKEFVNLSLTSDEPHWNPMHSLCNPCAFKPTIIGMLESFGSDTRYILQQANLSWIVDNYDHDTHVETEIVTLINYNIGLMSYVPTINKCTSKLGIFQRLWKTFQISGYLPATVQAPMLRDNTATAEFTRIVLSEYRKRPNTPEAWKRQRQEFMIAAYKTISASTLNYVREKYSHDFTFFNYDPSPIELFNNKV